MRSKIKGFLHKFYRLAVKICFLTIFRLIPVDKNMAVFLSFHGVGYNDNPRAIFEEMKNDESFKHFTFVWFLTKKQIEKTSIEGALVVKYNSLAYFYYMSRAKYWIVNCKLPVHFKKKKSQIYLQTWHGTPLKHLAHDIKLPEGTTFYKSEMSYEEMLYTYDVDVQRYDYMISPNRFCTNVFQSAFRIDKDLLIETGYPRNDIITNATEQSVKLLKEKYHIPPEKKVILYAPTWRDNSYVSKGYTFELKADFDKWKEILGADYVVLFKPHYLIINKYEKGFSHDGFLCSVDATAEINELYIISDVLITDYSSAFFDYAVKKCPIYFFMYDLDDYRDLLRGLYLDVFTELPGEIYSEEEKMLYDIRNQIFDYHRLKEFNERFNHAQTGDCAKKVLEVLKRNTFR